MTTHDREKIIAIAEEVKANNDRFGDFSVALYAIAFENGRKVEREEQAKHIQPCGNCGRDLATEIRARGDMK